jgi:hypothetical protein
MFQFLLGSLCFIAYHGFYGLSSPLWVTPDWELPGQQRSHQIKIRLATYCRKENEKMKIKEMIKKYDITLIERNGQEMLRAGKPPKSAAQLETLKAAKAEIIEELKRQDAERKARWAAHRAEADRKREEYIATADLRRCLVAVSDEYWNVRWAIDTLVFVEKEGKVVAYQPEYRAGEYKALRHETATIIAFRDKDCFPYGLAGTAWEITPEQEETLLAEQGPAAEKAEKEAREVAEKKAAEEAAKAQRAVEEKEAKFQEARETGEPVLLHRWNEPCNDPREECSMDIVTEYAMPDGSTKVERRHTW